MKSNIKYLIDCERHAQDIKWGEQNHDDYKWLAILSEEVGELAKEILSRNDLLTLNELTQVAAVAVAWLEAIERRNVPQ